MKVVFISSLQPFGHYSQILCRALVEHSDLKLLVYAERDARNYDVKECGDIKQIWNKNILFWWDILKQIRKDKPDVIHIQHEFTMYGGAITAVQFPLLLVCLKLFMYPIIVTLHAVPAPKQINNGFLEIFNLNNLFIQPFFLKTFFNFLFKSISLLSDCIICHTELAKKTLVDDYGINQSKISVIPTIIPTKSVKNQNPKKYFLYYGYISQRKGLEGIIKEFSKFNKSHTEYKLILAGGTISGQEQFQESLHSMISSNDNIIIKGYVKNESGLDKLYKHAFAVIVPAKISIAASGPLYHAQGYRCPILASNTGHLMEEVEHMEDGLLVNNNNWKKAFEQITKSPDLRATLIKGTQKRAEEKSPEYTAKNYLQLYSELT